MPKKNNDHLSTKYHYNVNTIIGEPGEGAIIETTQSIYQHRKQPSEDFKTKSKEKVQEKEPETPISFEHRYTHKFTGADQYEAYKRERDDKVTRHQ